MQNTVYILKAIGNIANEEGSLSAIIDCFSNDEKSLDVKLAAIDALRRKPCTEERKNKIAAKFFNKKV